MIKKEEILYQDEEGTTLKGYCCWDDSHNGSRPGVLVCHDWSGKNAFAHEKAEMLASLGYLGFALDMYGNGKTSKIKEEKIALMQQVMPKRSTLLLSRLNAALTALKALPECDANKLAAIGFCFGGLCALDLARNNPELKAIVSFHGLLNRLEGIPIKPITAKILVLHGFLDPMVPPDTLMSFAKEMQSANAHFEIDIYSHTLHAFTNPDANDPALGTVFNQKVATRAFQSMQTFLKENLT